MTLSCVELGAQALWLGEDDVVASVSLVQAIEAVRRAHLRSAAGQVVSLPKTFASWEHGTLHAVGAVAVADGLAVVKTWAHTPAGAAPLVLAWDVATGRLRAVIEAFSLGQLRTSAVCGVATAAMAAQRCDVLGVIGSGHQAEGQIAAVAAVRDVRAIRIYSPTEEHRVALAQRVAERSRIDTTAVSSAEEALEQASIVVTVTRARQPFVTPSMLADGAHINAVGAIAPDRAELRPDVLCRARRVVADDVAASRQLAPRELSGTHAPPIVSLASVLAQGDRRPDDGTLTIFKSVGSGISDLALAELVIERAHAAGRGRTLVPSARTSPQMWATA